MAESQWQATTNRFIAFFDILGFKDLVQRNTHEDILKKLDTLKKTISELGNLETLPQFKGTGVTTDQTKSVTFSDSIIFFSKGATFNDALKIIFDSYKTLHNALNNGIAIKGALSFGQITVDFEKSLFFGQPIIDAYLLHEELQMLTLILDNNAEVMIRSLDKKDLFPSVLVKYKASLKSGKITHTLLRPYKGKLNDERIVALEKLYETTYGRPRFYIDNSLEFIKSFPNE